MEEDVERLVAAGYDRVADEYAALEGAVEWPRMRRLRELLDLLPARSRVLDLGCGSGEPALREIVDRGHTAIGVDVSGEQLARARRNVPEAELRQLGALELDLPAGSLGAVAALYLFDHIPRDRHPELLASIARWLWPGGLLLHCVETEDCPDLVGNWLGVQMFFSCHQPETSQRIVRKAGFEIVRAEEESQLEGEAEVPFLWLLSRRLVKDS